MILVCPISSCGYRSGLVDWDSPARPTAGTIAVPLMTNRTAPYRRGIEADLTVALIREISARTPMVVVEPSAADLVLEGAIVGYQESVVAEDPNDRVVEAALSLTVEIGLLDRRTGQYRFQGQRLSESVSYFVRGGKTQDEARLDAFRSFAERIVYLLGESW